MKTPPAEQIATLRNSLRIERKNVAHACQRIAFLAIQLEIVRKKLRDLKIPDPTDHGATFGEVNGGASPIEQSFPV